MSEKIKLKIKKLNFYWVKYMTKWNDYDHKIKHNLIKV